MHETTRLLRDLVAIPSINPMGRPLQGPEIFEHRLTAYLEDAFRALGVRHERQPVAPLRDNIVAYHEPPDATSTLLFEVHQDTVPVDGMTIDPFGAAVAGGRLSGRGACDVKGGMAAMLATFARLVRERPARCARVVLACTVDEESTFLGVQRLVRDDLRGHFPGPVAAVVAEPTGLDVVHAHKGVVRWHLRTAGRSCHSSRPERGVNAIYHMAALLPLVERFADELRAARSHPLLGPATLSVGRIEGGTSVNTVPDRCSVEIDRRVLPGETAAAAPAELLAYLKRQAPGHIDLSQSEPWLNCPALAPEGSEELVRRLGVAIDAVRGGHAVVAVPYGTDASTLAEAGVPAVVFGPGSIDQAHTCDEWVDLAEVEAASEVLYRLATAVD
jgi:acetylornithine deacetylase/succinyl-diaminopimelate desuccinylase-like protein